MRRAPGFLALALLIAAPAAAADLVLVMTYFDEDGTEMGTFDTFIGADAFLARSPDGELLFRSKPPVVTITDRQNGSYREVTRADLDRMNTMMKKAGGFQMSAENRKKLEEASRQMEKALEGLSDEQKEMARRSMPDLSRMADGPAQETVEELGKRTISGYPCKGYLVSRAGSPDYRIWTTDPKNADITAKDLKVMDSFVEFLGADDNPMTQSLKMVFHNWATAKGEGAISGMPVEIEYLDGDEAGQVARLTSAGKQAVEPGTYAVSRGLKKKSLMEP